jgi:ferredoxin
MIQTAVQCFSVHLVNEEKGIDTTLEVSEDELILDVAEDGGLQLPYSCRAGACFDCLGRVVEGKVEQSEKAMEFLRPEEIKAGYVLLCAASPRSHCTIVTHRVDELLGDE